MLPLRRSAASLLSCLLLLGACGDDDSPVGTVDTAEDADVPVDSEAEDSGSDDSAAPPDDTSTLEEVADTGSPPADVPQDTSLVLPSDPPAITGTYSTFIGDWTMPSGQEGTKCVVKRLDNADAIWVTRIRTALAKGSHHMIVYRSQETEERTTPFDCQPFVETLQDNTFPLMITQIREETLAFPNGVAFKFDPRQMVRIEAHYLNYFQEEITAHGDVHFDTIAPSDVVSEANMLFYGNPDFSISANSSYTTPWGFIPVPDGTRVFAMTGHTHQYGTNVEIHYAADENDTTPSEIYPGEEDYLWDEPPVVAFDPALTFGPRDGVRYRCSWDNTSDRSVGFGESANAEMCFLWAYYYPSDGYKICINTGSFRAVAEYYGIEVGDHVCCPGHFVCSLVSQFL